jgi:hypothetical protein
MEQLNQTCINLSSSRTGIIQNSEETCAESVYTESTSRMHRLLPCPFLIHFEHVSSVSSAIITITKLIMTTKGYLTTPTKRMEECKYSSYPTNSMRVTLRSSSCIMQSHWQLDMRLCRFQSQFGRDCRESTMRRPSVACSHCNQ